jgi:protein ImuA
MSSKAAVLEDLRIKIKGLERSIEHRGLVAISSSFPELDALLPGGGLALGSIIELIQSIEGCGALTLALKMAQPAIATKGGAWAVLDTDRSFYPPGIFEKNSKALDIKKLLLIRTEPRHAAWAFNQLLRCPDIGACFMTTPLMDNMNFRRFQLAAERGGGLGFIIRPIEAERKPCWASLRLRIEQHHSQSRKVSVKLLHVRGGKTGASLVL